MNSVEKERPGCRGPRESNFAIALIGRSTCHVHMCVCVCVLKSSSSDIIIKVVCVHECNLFT